ncbi:MAG: B12-binding domain-containing radical SAM protein [Candidatus Omnitrophica bacterium]|nr:B12-binding domain-containing radical SAM protein [Candidatus Omnitrophota bacterium]
MAHVIFCRCKRTMSFLLVLFFLFNSVPLGEAAAWGSLSGGATLAAPDIFEIKGREDELKAFAICRAIEERLVSSTDIKSIYLDDLLLLQREIGSISEGCTLRQYNNEIFVHLPDSDVVIRYFDPEKADIDPGFSITEKLRTFPLGENPRILQQIIWTKEDPPSKKFKPLARHFGEAKLSKPADAIAEGLTGREVFKPAGDDPFNVLLVWPKYRNRPARISSMHYLASAIESKEFLLDLARAMSEADPNDPFYKEAAKLRLEDLPNINVEVLDLSMADEDFNLAEFLKQKKYDLIGMSTLTQNHRATSGHMRLIRKTSPSSALIAGGWHASALPEDTIEETGAQLVVSGQGVETLADIVLRLIFGGRDVDPADNIGKISRLVEGVCFKDKDGKFVHTGNRKMLLGFDKYPYPHHSHARSVFKKPYEEEQLKDPRDEEKELRSGFVHTSFGCPFRCKYCANPAVYKRYMKRGLDNLKKELDELFDSGVRAFSFRDETWSFVPERADAIIKMMQAYKDRANAMGDNFYWSATTRADLLSREMLTKMRESGLMTLYFGIETGDMPLMKAVKGVSVDYEKILENIKICDELKIVTFSYLQVGLPGQDMASIMRTARFIIEAKAYTSSVFITLPLPGSPYFKPLNDGPIRMLSDLMDNNGGHDLRTETDELTYMEIWLIEKCFKALERTKSLKRQIADNGMNVMIGDETVIMGFLRTAAIVDKVIRTNPMYDGTNRAKILGDLLKSDTSLYHVYGVFLKHFDEDPWYNENPFNLTESLMDPEFARSYDRMLTDITFVNGYDILKEMDLGCMFYIMQAIWAHYKDEPGRSKRVIFDGLDAGTIISSLQAMVGSISLGEQKEEEDSALGSKIKKTEAEGRSISDFKLALLDNPYEKRLLEILQNKGIPPGVPAEKIKGVLAKIAGSDADLVRMVRDLPFEETTIDEFKDGLRQKAGKKGEGPSARLEATFAIVGDTAGMDANGYKEALLGKLGEDAELVELVTALDPERLKIIKYWYALREKVEHREQSPEVRLAKAIVTGKYVEIIGGTVEDEPVKALILKALDNSRSTGDPQTKALLDIMEIPEGSGERRLMEAMMLLNVSEYKTTKDYQNALIEYVKTDDHSRSMDREIARLRSEIRFGLSEEGDTIYFRNKDRQKMGTDTGNAAFVKNNEGMIRTFLADIPDKVLVRVPVEMFEKMDESVRKTFTGAYLGSPNGVIELYYMSGTGLVPESVYGKLGVEKRRIDFERTRSNTITLLPVSKDEEIDQTLIRSRIGDMKLGLNDTVISPVGIEGDQAFLARGTVLGLNLMYIYRKSVEKPIVDRDDLIDVVNKLRTLCGVPNGSDFSVKPEDVYALAAGEFAEGGENALIRALKKLVPLLPMEPIDREEQRRLYEAFREVVTKA